MGTHVFLNGIILPFEKAVIPITDRGFLYGDAVFETVRAYDGFPFQLKAHLNRLGFSATQLDIKLEDLSSIETAIKNLLEKNELKDGVLRITVSRGISNKRALLEDITEPTVLIQTEELPEIPESYYSEGVKAVTMTDNRNELCHLKNTNLLPSIIGKKNAYRKNAYEAIMISKRGFVTEGTTSNVFGVIDGTLITPPAGNKVLNGITRQVIIKIARELSIRIEEDALMGNELSIVSELFITNSVIEILPVTSVDDNKISSKTVGEITKKLHSGYRTVIKNWLSNLKTPVNS